MSSSRPSAYPEAKPIVVASGGNQGRYEALCRFVLRKRLIHVFAWSLAITWILLSLSTSPPDGVLELIAHPFNIWTIILTLLAFSFGVLPILVYRRIRLTPSKTSTAPSLVGQLRNSLLAPSTWHAMVLYATASVSLTACTILLHPDDWRVFVWRPTRMYYWHLNEPFVMLVASNIAFGVIYALRNVLNDRFSLEWPLTSSKTSPEVSTLERLQRGFWTTFQFMLILWVNFGTTYYFLRRPSYHVAGYLFKPFVKHFIRRGIALPDVYLPSLYLNLTTGLIWYLSETLFEAYASQPFNVSQHVVGASPTECLISGITSSSSSSYYQYFAMAELSEIAQGTSGAASNRRKLLFSDLSNPTPWGRFCRQALLTLGKDYQNLLHKGKPKPAVPVPTSPAVVKPSLNQTPRTPSTLKRMDIYAHGQRTPSERILDNVAGYLSTADKLVDKLPDIRQNLPDVPEPIADLKKSLSGRIPALFTANSINVLAANTPAAQPSQTQVPGTTTYPGILPRLWTVVKRPLPGSILWVVEKVESAFTIGWVHLNHHKVERQFDMILPNLALDIWTIEALCHLTARSFTEDPYGVVQKDIPKILEAILFLDRAVAEFRAELTKSLNDSVAKNTAYPADDEESIQRCIQKVERLHEAIRLGLHAIITTFQDRLTAFKFPPTTARMLQELVDNNL